jgi:hypothetical protein
MATADKRRVAVAVFNRAGDLEAALNELSLSGVDKEDICLLGRGNTISQMAGDCGPLSSFAKNLAAVREDGGSKPLLASSGRSIHQMLSEMPAERSVGERLATWIPGRQSRLLEQFLDNAAVVLWVWIGNTDLERLVPGILLRHTSHAVQVHEISG